MASNLIGPHPRERDQKNTAEFEVTMKLISRSIASCAKLGQWPIRWNDSDQSVSVDTSARSKLTQGYHVMLTLIHCGFCIVQLVSTMHDYSCAPAARIYIVIATVFSSMPVFYHGNVYLNVYDIVACLNMSTPFFRNYQKYTEERKRSRMTRTLPLLLEFICYSLVAVCILYLLLLLARPESPEWITSTLPTEGLRNSLVIKLMVFPLYIIWMYGVCTWAILLSIFTFVLAIWSQEVLKDLSDKIARVSNGRGLKENLSHYTQMRIIMKIYDQAIKTVIPMGKFVTIISSIYSLYAVVKIEGIVSLFCGSYALNMIFLLQLVLRVLAQPYVDSCRFLRKVQLRNECRTRFMRRHLRAMKPIAMTVGNGMYFIDNQLILTVMQIIVTNAVNVLLVYKN